MKRILIVSEKDVNDINKGVAGLKPGIKELEPESDDIFIIDNNQKITCIKARNGRAGNYTSEEFNQYVIENK